MAQFKIKYTGLDSIEHKDWEIIEAKDEEEANTYAWEMACDDLDSYGGMHGTPCAETIADENPDWSEDECWEAYCEERESWLSYMVEEVAEGETEENLNG